MKKSIAVMLAAIFTLAVAAIANTGSAFAQERAICYNCPPEWADWGSQLRAIRSTLGIHVPPDNKNSGQSIAALITEKNNPVADVVYLGGITAGQAVEAGVLQPYKPVNWDRIPDDLKHPDGYWFTIHLGTLGLFVNTAALGNRPVPQSWSDLLKPKYRGMVGYLDPTSAAVGQLGVMAVNLALGGDYDNLDPGIQFFRELRRNQPIVPKQTAYARVISGEIPILFDFDFNAYRGKYTDGAPVQFVIPSEGTLTMPYVMGLVAGGPNGDNGRKILDFVLSDQSQKMWGNAFLRPVFADKLSDETRARFLPDADYARARVVDLARLGAAQSAIVERYRNEVE